MVSTDDVEIAAIAKHYGATVPFFRSAKNADDYATTMDVLVEVVAEYESRGASFDTICCIYPTAPLLSIQYLEAGWSKLREGEFEVVLPVVSFSYPVWRGLKRNDNGQTSLVWPENLNKRSQDFPSVYHDAGQWYWFSRKAIGKPIFGDRCASIILSEETVQDIDTITDWKLAELKYELLQGS